ncbi:MAG: zinc-dependent alcohol dehydrogenase family protein [Gemmatimonadetes bacterium]|nr:zinc-dependent alcohol dehydrogenase family protein [Gemmatimonadota bacterium]
MRAVLFDRFGGPFRTEVVDDPAPPADAVVLQVGASGICRSDWHGWQGHDPDITTFPHVPGHEFAGTVVAVGAEVRAWRGGERVTSPFVCGCGTCAPCSRGDHQVCDHQTQPGFTHWGSFAEYVVVRHADVNLVALPDAMTMITAAGLGCRFATAFRAVADQGRVRDGEWVAVHGCGGVGLSAVMIAAALGARVIAIDLDERTLARAQALGAAVVLNGAAVDVPAAIREVTEGGADCSLDTLGAAVTASASIASLRKNGRHVQVGLLAGRDHRPALPMELVIARELELVGSHGMAAHAYPRMLAMIADGRLAPDQLIARTVPLDAAAAELEALEERSAGGMVVIDLSA